MQYTITATVFLEKSLWVAIFERTDDAGIQAARAIFGKEPTDPELYQYIIEHFVELKFSKPEKFNLVVKRKNPKRIQREVRREMAKAKSGAPRETHAQEMLRKELEKNKLEKKTLSKQQKDARDEEQFLQRQEKRKKKKRGH